MRQDAPRTREEADNAVRVAKINLRSARALQRQFQKTEKRATSRGLSKPLSDYRKDRDECDKLMSRIVRVQRGECERCHSLARRTFQWAHMWSRGYHSVRYDFGNCWCLCSGCHFFLTNNKIEHDAFMRLTLGVESYDALYRRAQFKTRHDPRLVIGLRAEAERLGILTDEGWKLWMEG